MGIQVLLRKSNIKQDIHCTICNQGFRLYWERPSLAEQTTMRAIVLAELAQHHTTDNTHAAHPTDHFNLPTWSGQPQFSGAALLGGLSGLHRTTPKRQHSR